MEKVKITQAQANAIDWVMKFSDKSSTVEEHIEYRQRGWRLDDLKPLNELSTDYLIRALYIGYEVEPEPFKVGDWVVHVHSELCTEITKIYDKQVWGYWGSDTKETWSPLNNSIKHATPEEIAEEKERRFWKKHGRDVWELKGGDVLFDIEMNEIVQVEFSGLLQDYKRKDYTVVCFTESRLDVKTNE